MKKTLILGVVVSLTLSLALTGMVYAGEHKGKGTVTYVVVQSDSAKRADGSTIMRNHSKGIVVDENTSSPIHLVAQDCFGTDLIGADGKPVVSNGYCDAEDRDGDVWWIWWHNGADGNTWGFIGGTGKFEGITGGGTTTQLVMYPDGRLIISWEGTWTMK